MISMGYNSLILLYFWQEIIQLAFCLSQFFMEGDLLDKPDWKLYRQHCFSVENWIFSQMKMIV